MQVFHDEATRKHSPEVEVHRGQILSPFENPQRIQSIVTALTADSGFELAEPQQHSLQLLETIHDPDYLQFLQTIYEEWSSLGHDGHLVPHVWPSRQMSPVVPESVFGKLGFYSFDAGTTIAEGTWDTAFASANCALTAATVCWNSKLPTFALCRPPGHHAERAAYGGYCFLNTAALAVQQLQTLGAERVAVMDVDYHHGNGTQSIFYQRPDVLTVSIHADPQIAYPYFTGYEHEVGVDAGFGTNRNFCTGNGTTWPQYRDLLLSAIQAVTDFQPQAVVIPFGADTYHADPISTFALHTDDFSRMGQLLASIKLPKVVTMEGGYAIDDLGRNVASFLAALS